MRTSYPQVALQSVAVPRGLVGGPFGSSLGGRDYVDRGVPVIRGTNLNGHRELAGDYVYVTQEKADGELSRNQAIPGDLIFTQRGTLGQVAIAPPLFDRYVISQSQMRLRVDCGTADGRYVFYACSTNAFIKQVRDNAISTGVPHINLGVLARLTIPAPPLTQQRAIAEVLGALDDKIAVNAQLISGTDRLSRVTFESILGDEAVPLSSVARFINGKAFTKDATGTGRVVIRIAELNSGLGGSTVYNDLDVPDEHLARPGDLLFAWSGSLTVHRWFRPEAIVNQHIFKVIPADGYPLWCVNGALRRKLAEFQAIAANKATTMGHIQRRHLDEVVAVPTRAKIEQNDGVMTGLWQRALAAEVESLQLGQMRDTLLPQLMSGKIRVKDAEHVVSEAV